MISNSRIHIAGHRGLVGSAIQRTLESKGFSELLTPVRSELDLRNQADVFDWYEKNRPEYVFLVAGTVGGILANSTRPAEFLYDNIMIHANVLEAARRVNVTKLLYLGSSCIYPRMSMQPIAEHQLLQGALEPTNEAYALAKISGIKMCSSYRSQYGCNFISAMPTNLYGPNDNFDLKGSHVLPALIRKFHEAKQIGSDEVVVWGTGSPLREFLHVDDLADACLFLMDNYEDSEHINVGTGDDLPIRDLANVIREIVYPECELVFDTTRPDGTPRKVLDVGRLEKLGWKAQTNLREGIEATYQWFLEQYDSGQVRGAA